MKRHRKIEIEGASVSNMMPSHKMPTSFHCHGIVYLLWLTLFSLRQTYSQVQAQELIVIDPWVIPIDNIPYPTRSAVQGDVVSFHYRGNHNVYVALESGSADDNGSGASTFSCDTQDAIQVGATGSEYGNYTLMLSDNQGSDQTFSSVTFFCNYTSHCERGQQLQFHVYASRQDIPPTQAPSTMPTLSPTTSAPSMIPTVEVTAAPFASLFDTTFAPTPASGSAAMSLPYWVTSNLVGGVALMSLVVALLY